MQARQIKWLLNLTPHDSNGNYKFCPQASAVQTWSAQLQNPRNLIRVERKDNGGIKHDRLKNGKNLDPNDDEDPLIKCKEPEKDFHYYCDGERISMFDQLFNILSTGGRVQVIQASVDDNIYESALILTTYHGFDMEQLCEMTFWGRGRGTHISQRYTALGMFNSKNLQKLFIFVKENLDLKQQPSINDPQQPKRRQKK